MRVPGHPRIEIDPDICFGKPCIAGTRMRVTDILCGLGNGDTEAEIVADFPYVTAEDIRACLIYAADLTASPMTLAAAAE